jgi:hypothetical protein
MGGTHDDKPHGGRRPGRKQHGKEEHERPSRTRPADRAGGTSQAGATGEAWLVCWPLDPQIGRVRCFVGAGGEPAGQTPEVVGRWHRRRGRGTGRLRARGDLGWLVRPFRRPRRFGHRRRRNHVVRRTRRSGRRGLVPAHAGCLLTADLRRVRRIGSRDSMPAANAKSRVRLQFAAAPNAESFRTPQSVSWSRSYILTTGPAEELVNKGRERARPRAPTPICHMT